MGRPIIHNNNPSKFGGNDGSTRNTNFIVGKEKSSDKINFPDEKVNFTYRKADDITSDDSSKKSVNPLQFLETDNDTKIFCEIDVDFKNNKFVENEDGTKQIEQYCYKGNEANTNIKYHTDYKLEDKIYQFMVLNIVQK